MPVSFDQIVPHQDYARKDLAAVWGYRGIQALARGVVTPREDNKIILFVTVEKQNCMEPYVDDINSGFLKWEGPTDHFAEQRILNADAVGEEIHLFFRVRHHMAFTYYGKLTLVHAFIFSDKPSKFIFKIHDSAV